MRKCVVTGVAGFIGSNLAEHLLSLGDEVAGIDNINDYYDVRLKYGRLTACIIAPRGVNHNGSLDMAPEMVDVAVVADAVTFRNFLAERLVRKDIPKPEYRKQTTGTQENRFYTEANA